MLSPLLVLYTLWRARKDGGKRYLQQRLGLYSRTQPATTQAIWIHAASVGEVFTVLPLLKQIRTPLLVTTMSPTGAAVLEQQALSHVEHRYLPIDLRGACERFFQNTNISEGWIVETEIWPWLYASARQQQIALTIINARISDRTSSRARGFMASTFKQALKNVRILARSEDDARRFEELGATPASIRTIGNLKYANDCASNMKWETSPLGVPYVLAASTHADEEEQLALAWQRTISPGENSPVLVIVPRHPERGTVIQKQLAGHGIHAPLRSMQQCINKDSPFYIADTLGELQTWYSSATACFVGGSLIERGGHNVLEAARLGCPIIVGPHTFNFADIIKTLSQQEAILIADHADEVAQLLQDIAADPQSYAPMIQRAGDQARLSEGVLTEYLELLV